VVSSGFLPQLLAILKENDNDIKARALNALINLALSFNNTVKLAETTNGLTESLLSIIHTGPDSLKLLACKLFVNLTASEIAREPLCQNIKAVTVFLSLLNETHPVFHLQALKLLTNLTLEGKIRKWFHESHHVEKVQAFESSTVPDISEQAKMVLANLSFPFEENYDESTHEMINRIIESSNQILSNLDNEDDEIEEEVTESQVDAEKEREIELQQERERERQREQELELERERERERKTGKRKTAKRTRAERTREKRTGTKRKRTA
jgi:hypothetical protein